MNAAPFTLLVVESPTLARIINRFALPGVEAMATGGFSWQPEWDGQKNELRPTAHPSGRDFRKQLKEKAAWATRIVVATDADPAGSFLSCAISRFLKNFQVQRTYLNTLSPGGVKKAIERASEPGPEEFIPLQNRFLIRQELERHFRKKLGRFPWAKITLLSLFQEKVPIRFLTNGTRTLHLVRPISARPGTEFTAERIHCRDDGKPARIFRPLNTAALLELLYTGTHPLADVQEQLNRLFTGIPNTLKTGLISYPRTSAQGYYPQTWEASFRFWIKKKDAESFLFPVLWEKLPRETPHESIHPLDPDETPAAVRPLLPKKHYEIYRTIHQHHMHCISAESLQPAGRISLGEDHLSVEVRHIDEDGILPAKMKAAISVADLLNAMDHSGAARPSGFGELFDTLRDEEWIAGSGLFVEPGPAFTRTVPSVPFPLHEWLKKIAAMIANRAVTPAELTRQCTELCRALPL